MKKNELTSTAQVIYEKDLEQKENKKAIEKIKKPNVFSIEFLTANRNIISINGELASPEVEQQADEILKKEGFAYMCNNQDTLFSYLRNLILFNKCSDKECSFSISCNSLYIREIKNNNLCKTLLSLYFGNNVSLLKILKYTVIYFNLLLKQK